MIAMGNGRISRIGSDLDGKQAGVRRDVDAVQQFAPLRPGQVPTFGPTSRRSGASAPCALGWPARLGR